MDDILSELNDAQREAVVHQAGPLLVVAGAGSGKTRVITRRIAWLIQNGLRPSEVLAITFTNKAAGEMRERVSDLVGQSRAWISTFHALGARILRIEADAAGLDRNFTIFDASDQAVLVREILKELKLKGREHRPGDYLASISRHKSQGRLSAAEIDDDADDIGVRVFQAYQEALDHSQALDFDDLLCRPVRLFEDQDDVRERFASRFRTLLIDEYQDTNQLQYRLAQLIVRDHGDICGTGDPDQLIYRWRGADIRNILRFERDFPGATVVKLEENYRSTNGILKAAGALIAHNRSRVERDLWSSLGTGESVHVMAGEYDLAEAYKIVEGIQDALTDGYRLDQIAVFYRTNACSRVLEQALRRGQVPYAIIGAVEFYERREIKDLMAYLRVISNPYDALDLTRIINVPSRGIGARTVARLREEAQSAGLSYRDLLLEHHRIPGLRANTRRALEGFSRLLSDLLAMPRTPVLPVLDSVLTSTGYVRHLEEANDALVEDRIENVEELRRAVLEYDARHPDGSLEDFVNETVLLRSRDREEEHIPRVTMMTLHAAKGLEFPIVFIAGVEEGLLPHARSMNSEDEVEEERRLLYVGMTRAKRRLTLSFSRRRVGGSSSFGGTIPSRFLAEIPDELCDGMETEKDDWSDFDESLSYEPDPCDGEAPFEPGDRVVHSEFGSGNVLRLSGFGPTARIIVDFKGRGQKELILEYARLRKIREEY